MDKAKPIPIMKRINTPRIKNLLVGRPTKRFPSNAERIIAVTMVVVIDLFLNPILKDISPIAVIDNSEDIFLSK